jgi:hypothetical protein
MLSIQEFVFSYNEEMRTAVGTEKYRHFSGRQSSLTHFLHGIERFYSADNLLWSPKDKAD